MRPLTLVLLLAIALAPPVRADRPPPPEQPSRSDLAEHLSRVVDSLAVIERQLEEGEVPPAIEAVRKARDDVEYLTDRILQLYSWIEEGANCGEPIEPDDDPRKGRGAALFTIEGVGWLDPR